MVDVSPSEREMDVLKVLWELGESKVRDVHQAMNAEKKTAFTTVQTLLRIMNEKKLVTSRSEGRTLYYTSNYSPTQASSHFLSRVFDGALDKMVLHMLQSEKISPKEMKGLEDLIAKARAEKGTDKGNKSQQLNRKNRGRK